MNKEDIEFLKDLQHEMLTQDNVSQADPRFWVVRGTIQEYGYDSGYADGYCICDCANDLNIEDMVSACEWLNELDNKYDYQYNSEDDSIMYYSEIYEGMILIDDLQEVCEHVNDNFNKEPYICYYKNVDKIYENTMFLTNRECKEHIERNYYHYPHDAHSYAMTAWRSPQVERLYKILQNTNWDGIATNN